MRTRVSIGGVQRLNPTPDCGLDVDLGKPKPKLRLTSGDRSNNAMPTPIIHHQSYLMVGADTVRHWWKFTAKCLTIMDVDDLQVENKLLRAGIIRKWLNNAMRKAT